jgi:hypothetical protein
MSRLFKLMSMIHVSYINFRWQIVNCIQDWNIEKEKWKLSGCLSRLFEKIGEDNLYPCVLFYCINGEVKFLPNHKDWSKSIIVITKKTIIYYTTCFNFLFQRLCMLSKIQTYFIWNDYENYFIICMIFGLILSFIYPVRHSCVVKVCL